MRYFQVFSLLGCTLLASCSLTRPAPTHVAVPAAAASTQSAGCGTAALHAEVLARLNAVRAAGHACGNRMMAPAGPLKWDATLHSAAAGHSLDMARRNYFAHNTPEGEGVGERASRNHYAWRNIAENIAAGDTTVAEAMDGWLESPGHCTNMLGSAYADVAVACVQQPGSKWRTYWTMVLGRRR